MINSEEEFINRMKQDLRIAHKSKVELSIGDLYRVLMKLDLDIKILMKQDLEDNQMDKLIHLQNKVKALTSVLHKKTKPLQIATSKIVVNRQMGRVYPDH